MANTPAKLAILSDHFGGHFDCVFVEHGLYYTDYCIKMYYVYIYIILYVRESPRSRCSPHH